MANRVSNEQLDELLEFLAANPNIARGVGQGTRCKETIDKQWNDLALKLNALGSGSAKTGDRWKKYWADLKFKTKSRLIKRRHEVITSGGDPSSTEDISDLDRKVLSIVGEQAIYGDMQDRIRFNIQSIPATEATATTFTANVHSAVMPAYPPASPSSLHYSPQPIEFIKTEVDSMSDTSEIPGPDTRCSSAEPPTRMPEPIQTAAEPMRFRTRFRRYRPSLTKTSAGSKIRHDPKWAIELEKRRVQAECKMADAALIMAEASKKIAEASLLNATTARLNAETSKRQVEALNTVIAVVGQLAKSLERECSRDSKS